MTIIIESVSFDLTGPCPLFCSIERACNPMWVIGVFLKFWAKEILTNFWWRDRFRLNFFCRAINKKKLDRSSLNRRWTIMDIDMEDAWVIFFVVSKKGKKKEFSYSAWVFFSFQKEWNRMNVFFLLVAMKLLLFKENQDECARFFFLFLFFCSFYWERILFVLDALCF